MVKFVYDDVNGLIKCFKIYEVEELELKEDNSRYFSIDLGLNNIVSIYNNIGIRPLLYNGRPIKSINQYYNKTKAKLQSELPANVKSSRRLKQLSFKRNNKIDYEMHKISTDIINEAVKIVFQKYLLVIALVGRVKSILVEEITKTSLLFHIQTYLISCYTKAY